MKPFIFQFLSEPEIEETPSNLFEYSASQNLNIIKGSNTPAVFEASLDTETFTKAHTDTMENDDPFTSKMLGLLDTNFETRATKEVTQIDDCFPLNTY